LEDEGLIEKIRGIILSAIDYAIKYNLPLPSDVSHYYFLHGKNLPDWIQEHYADPSAKHHVYYRFAIEEYRRLVRYLVTGEGELGELTWGERLVELVQQGLFGLKGT
jgi:hypothetical protein